MKIHVLEHSPIGYPNYMDIWAKANGHQVSITKMCESPDLAKIEDYDLLLVLGGKMSAYQEEEFPWLRTEKEYIRKAISSNKFVLGICLGSQLIAEVIGGKVFLHEHWEIGFMPMRLTEEGKRNPFFYNIPEKFMAIEFHQDTFSLPESALLLASSPGCKNQAFSIGDRVIGLQFHPEITKEQAGEICEELFENHDFSSNYIQIPEEILSNAEYFDNQGNILCTLLENIHQFLIENANKI